MQRAPHEDDRDGLINDATQKALERFDETMRELALRRYREFERELGPAADALRRRRKRCGRFGGATICTGPTGVDEDEARSTSWRDELTPEFGPLARQDTRPWKTCTQLTRTSASDLDEARRSGRRGRRSGTARSRRLPQLWSQAGEALRG